MSTPYLAVAAADSVTWVTLASVSGDSGTLTGIGVAGGPDYHYFRISIDGAVLAADFLAGTGVAGHVSNGVGISLPFSTDLVVDVRDGPTRSPITRFWAAFVTDHSDPIDESFHLETVEGTEYRYQRRRFTKDDIGTYVVETLLGPRRVAEIRLKHDFARLHSWTPDAGGYVQLAGDATVTDFETGEQFMLKNVPAFVRPAGRAEVVSEALIGERGQLEAAELWLPGPGDYAIASSEENCSNLPAFFTAR